MKSQKAFRLFLGLIILFSIFLFHGGDDHHGCTQCDEKNPGGTLEISNNGISNIIVLIKPLGGSHGLVSNDTKVVYLNEGLYQVIIFKADGLIPVKVLKVRMFDIKMGSFKKIANYD